MSPSNSIITLVIDGKPVSALAGETILQVARENEIDIPTLCNLDGIDSTGACRLCLVEIKGYNKLLPACVTKISDGMEVCTQSERLKKYRRMILELVFSERNHICAVCVSNGHCELQSMAQELGVDHIRYAYRNPDMNVDASHQQFVADQNRCILCTRCVRVCDQIEGAHTWDVMERGINSNVITDFDMPWGDSETCTSCGKCVNVCPTGALSIKGSSVAEMAKRKQFLPYLVSMREVNK